MLNLDIINTEISKLENGDTTYDNCRTLSYLYIVRDALSGTKTRSNDRVPTVARTEPPLDLEIHTEYIEPLQPFTRTTAIEWTDAMSNTDGSHGPHWTMDQTKQVQAQRTINLDPAKFFAILNSIYSDYFTVAKKYGVDKLDFYVDMAKAWLDDEDAVKDKAEAYWEYVVKH